MVLLKIVLIGSAIVALMVVAQNQRWPQRAGVVGVLHGDPAPALVGGQSLVLLQQGLFSGFPNLGGDRCVTTGIVQHARGLAVRRAARLTSRRVSA